MKEGLLVLGWGLILGGLFLLFMKEELIFGLCALVWGNLFRIWATEKRI